MLTRAEFLQFVASMATTGLVGGWPKVLARTRTTPQGVTNDLIARVSRVIDEYDHQGIHRTATETDNRSASWLVERAKQAGAEALIVPFAISRVDVQGAYVEAGGRRAEALPLFDGSFTGASGLEGRLGKPDANTEIALIAVESGAIASEGRGLADLRRSDAHKAIVVITRGARSGLTPMNAADFVRPYGCPVLQVSSADAPWLEELAESRTIVKFVAHATRNATHAYNVIATINGRRRNLPPVMVMTPRSGWWHCAGERGGGLACWLEAIRAVSAAQPPRTVRFLASSGHELGHFGLDAYLSNQPGLVKSAAGWIHLGANIGAAGGRARLQASSDEIEKIASAALVRAGRDVEDRVPRRTVPSGEARNIHLGGGRYISLLGTSPLFHNVADRWPDAVDPPAVARFATAFGDVAVSLASRT